MVPLAATILMAARAVRPVPVALTEARSIEQEPVPVPVPVAEARSIDQEPVQLAKATSSNRVKVSYEVKPGDTLASIAHVFKTTVASLKTWNKIPGNHIAAGERLTIYPPSAAARVN